MKIKVRLLLMSMAISLFFFSLGAQTFSDYSNERRRTEHYYIWVPDTGGTYTRVQRNVQYDPILNSTSAEIGRTRRGIESTPGEAHRYSSKMSYQWNFSSIANVNASVLSVRIELWFTSSTDKPNTSDISIQIKPLTNDRWNGTPDDRWAAIKNAAPYRTIILPVPRSLSEYWSPIDFTSSSSICTDIENAIKAGTKFCLAFMSSDDEDWASGTGSYRSIELRQENQRKIGVKLTVNYKVPVSVTVKNSFDGGRIKIDNDTAASGAAFNWFSNETHTIKAFTQDIDGIHYPLKTTGIWMKNGTPYSDSNPLTVATTESATYQACFDLSTKTVSVTQKFSSGSLTPVGADSWEGGPDFAAKPNPWEPTFTVGTNYCLRGYQDIQFNTSNYVNEKYNNWNNLPDVNNHHSFLITQTTTELVSQFQPTTQGSTIKVDLLEAPGSYNGTVQFKDPWLIDYPDASYNNKMRNQGMSAPFKNRTAPFSPNIGTNYNGDVYKGVFLNQSGPLNN
jgi:hypothetical protein